MAVLLIYTLAILEPDSPVDIQGACTAGGAGFDLYGFVPILDGKGSFLEARYLR
jgi:hypothetical protein